MGNRKKDIYSTGCKYCDEMFMSDDDLAQHESSVHNSDLSDFKLNEHGDFTLKE